MMKRYLLIGAAAAAFAVPAGAFAAATPSANSLAVQSCKTQQAALGAAPFKATYGANAYGKCVSKGVRAAAANLASAAASCKTEQAMPAADFSAAHGGKTFDAFYGNAKGKSADANAYGKCVSQKAKATAQAQTQATVAAAKACKAELAASKTAFATAYGSKANAFGKCVALKAKAK
jgi:hypothetical protein